MYEAIKAERFSDLLSNPQVFNFSRRTITESYVACAPGHEEEMRVLLERAFALLVAARGDERRLQKSVALLIDEVFRKADPDFWFNRLYLHYKQEFKPRKRFRQLRPWLQGKRVLDLGCGSGRLSLQLAQGGFEPALTDVLDYRAPEARHLPFARMEQPLRIPYADGAFDSAVVMAVLHHVAPQNLALLLQELRRVTRRVIVEEDSFELPADLEGLGGRLAQDAQLRAFVALPPEDQLRYTMFLDYFANAITQGLPQMETPFDFKTVREWQRLFAEQGFTVRQTLLQGFQRGHFNRTCHVWFVLDVEEEPGS
jgi:SAM-dependent methyltransferase